MNALTPKTVATATGAESSQGTSWRSSRLVAQAMSELLSVGQACLANAASRGYSREELAASYLGGEPEFELLAAGASPSFEQAVELARACGYRLRIGIEILDDETPLTPAELKTPFEVTIKYVRNHDAFKDIPEDKQDDLVRGILHQYFSQMREKGFYMANRG